MTTGLQRFAAIFALSSNLSIGAWLVFETAQSSAQANETLSAFFEMMGYLAAWGVFFVLVFLVLRGAIDFPFTRTDVQSSSATHGDFRNGGPYPWL